MKSLVKKVIPKKYHWQIYNAVRDLIGWRSKSYSSFAEDIVVSQLSGNKKGGLYVDVGAFHPFKYSNTYYLKKYYNWRGINIEPNPENFKLFKKHRSNDINLNIGIASEKGQLEYYSFIDPLFNTFDQGRVKELEQEGMKALNKQKIQVLPLAEVIEQNLNGESIDFLNVDVEMLDLEVLKSLNWQKQKPKVIAVEDHGMNLDNPKDSEIYKHLTANNYTLESKCHFTTIYKLN